MRHIKHTPNYGDQRVNQRFLWLPKRIGNETRWLEYAIWDERFSVFSQWYATKWWPDSDYPCGFDRA